MGDYAPTTKPTRYGKLDFATRLTLARHARAIRIAKLQGVVFSSFPTYVKATDLKTGDVAYGRDAYSAVQAIRCARAMRNVNRGIVEMERAAVWAEFKARAGG